jgi:nitroimidazol reductase NimA-like FMN-containing flavoprotein (pyridoxamine 5'-phosphate oxidase superfamily)
VPSPTARTRVARIPERGHYDATTIHAILDAAHLCHVGFALAREDGGAPQPFVTPTLFGRDGDQVFFHGSAASRMLRHAGGGFPVCLEVTIEDGIVLARSAFNHSMNYRSVVVVGTAELVTDTAQKLRALEIISENVVPGRWADVRFPTEQELKATSVLRLPLDEASAKIRSGPPGDEDADYALPVWAGVLPLSQQAGELQADPRLTPGIPVPEYLKRKA